MKQIRQWWSWLLRPHPRLTSLEERLGAQFFSVLMLVHVLLVIVLILATTAGCLGQPQAPTQASPTSPAPLAQAAEAPPPETPSPELAAPSPSAPGEESATPTATPQAPPSPSPSAAGSPPAPLTGRLLIPSLAVDVPVVEVSWHLEQVEGQTLGVWDTVSGAAGHHRGTAPFGAAGNCVLSGHSRSAEGGVFQRLAELKPGDKLLLVTAAGDTYQYVVESLRKLPELGEDLAQRRAHAAVMAPTQDARLTLITCWPDWAYTHRLVVVARFP